MNPRILGFVMARDEWPLLGISILNAFRRGVDHIVVLNHASVDNTADGLARISELYPNKLTVFEMHDGSVYLQEASVSLALAHVDTASFDWVYVFDADEILITAEGLTLPEILKAIPKETTSVRYHIDQWVWPRGFDEDSPRSYLHVTARAVPSVFLDMAPELRLYELERGAINYFDFPFPSKIMVRPEHLQELLSGAHLAIGNELSKSLGKDQAFVAHIPIRGVGQLERKARQGRLLVESGFPLGHGWQNQSLARIAARGGIEEYWKRHSKSGSDKSVEGLLGYPTTVSDGRLGNQMAEVLEEFEAVTQRTKKDLRKTKSSRAPTEFESIPVSLALRTLQEKIRQRDKAMSEIERALIQRDYASFERDEALTRLDASMESISAIHSTRSWRWTAWFRKLFGRR